MIATLFSLPVKATRRLTPMRRHALQCLRVSALATAALLATGTAATAAEAGTLPAEQEQQGVSYLSGGVDLAESTAIKAAMPRYPLVVEVFHSAGGKNEYTASSELTLVNAQGDTVLSTTLEGPFALLRVKPGAYEVKVNYEGQAKARRVNVKSSGSQRASFVFSR